MNINRQTLRLYWQQSRQHKTSFFIMLICIPTGAMMIDSIMPYFLSEAIGAVAQQQYEVMTNWLIVAGVTGIIAGLLNLAGFQAMVHHEANILRKERESVFEQLIEKDHQFFSNQKIGAMTSRYIDFIRSHISIQDLFIIRTLSFVCITIAGVGILLVNAWQLAVLVMLLIALLIWQIRWSTKKRAPWRHERKTLVGDIHGAVADALTNNLIIRTFAAEKREVAELKKLSKRFSTLYKKDIGFIVKEGSARVMLMIIIQIAVVAFAAYMIQQNSLPLATAIFAIAYMQRVGSQLFILADIINGYDQSFLDAQPMTEMLLTKNVIADKPDAKPLSVIAPTISFEQVSYGYPDGNENVISNLNLTIPAGQKVGLVGHSGAGKSTIVQLLLRFSDVLEGHVKIAGQDIRDVSQHSLRESIAYVPQEPMLFHRSLRENIAYAKPHATERDIRRAAKRAHALEFIDKMPHKLDTTVGERGVKLSGGQRQRIAIARAILKDAPILVLDEATSALDSESEKMIQASLDELMKNRTSIVIAHRLSTIAKLDRIVVLENGTIVEDGTHADLLKQNGIYASLWAHQSGGFIEE
ncbi:MAG: ABC transporter ATP-binding protein [Candidatus Saccharimonadales bacterium]